MISGRWMIPLVAMAISGCATGQKDSVPPSAAKAAPDVVPAQVRVVFEQPAAAVPQEIFEDAAAPVETVVTSSWPAEVSVAQKEAFETAPISRIAESESPSYAVASLTDPALIETVPAMQPQTVSAPSPAPDSAMAYVAALEASGSAPDGSSGYILMDARDGTILSERNADLPLAPASMGKLLATVAILEAKGANGRFRTVVLADGPVEGGVLNGDLHLVGSGDPSLLSADVQTLAQRVADAGIGSITGSFYFHGDALPETTSIDPEQPAGALYNPGIGGLNLDHNEKNGVSPVKNPGRYTASAFRKYAEMSGLNLPAPKRASSSAQGQEIAAHESQPVSEILTEMFVWSRNMTAEALGAAAASALSHKPNSLADAAQVTSTWVQGQIGSIGGSEWAGFDFPDHSGLSSRSRATARQMAAIVRFGYERFGEDFKRVYKMQSEGNEGGVSFAVRAKIGTMSYVRGLAGLVTLNGRDMIFAIMAQDPAHSTGHAETWMMKARKLEQALMSDWLADNWPG